MFYKNIFYFRLIKAIGGTEQFLYEIAKKYNNWDITILCDNIDPAQRARLLKFVRVIVRVPNQEYECDRAFFNFNLDAIDFIKAKKYFFISHANYEELGYKPPIDNDKLTDYIGVSQFAANKLKEWGDILNKNIEVMPVYNPLTLEPKKKVIRIISAARLDDKVKGGERTKKLIAALDKYAKESNRNYIWTIYSNINTNIDIKSPNVVIMPPRLDIRPYIADSTYLAQLSNDMETYCYSINEALSYGVPIISTPLSILKELPITDNEKIILDWDCSNVDEVAKAIFEKEVKPFKYKAPADTWYKYLAKGESTYKADLNKVVNLVCISRYTDIMVNKNFKEGDILHNVPTFRAKELVGAKVAKIISE